jgi:hypothetical protein
MASTDEKAIQFLEKGKELLGNSGDIQFLTEQIDLLRAIIRFHENR